MQTSIVLIVIVLILVIICASPFISEGEPYDVRFYSRTNTPDVMKLMRGGYAQSGGLCIGQYTNSNGQQLTLQDGNCDVFLSGIDKDGKLVLANNELVSREKPNNSVSAYYNANSDGQPLEYTNRWRGQKFSFDEKGKILTPDGQWYQGRYGTLRHVASGKCLHPEGGTANRNGQRLVVWGDCSPQDRIMWNVYDGVEKL